MAQEPLSETEAQVIAVLPRCCGCARVLHQLSSVILLPCTHFLYCWDCYVRSLKTMGEVVTCNLCGLQYSELEREEKLEEIAAEIKRLCEWEENLELRESGLKAALMEIRLVYEGFLNPSESKKSDTEAVSVPEDSQKTKDLTRLPASFFPDISHFQCESCGLSLPKGSFRCECGFVDLVSYANYHQEEVNQVGMRVRALVKGEVVQEEEGEEREIEEESRGKEEIVEVEQKQEAQQTGYQPFSDEPEFLVVSDPISSSVEVLPPSKPLLALARPPWEEEQPPSKVPWRLLATIVVLLLLIYDIYQVNVDAEQSS